MDWMPDITLRARALPPPAAARCRAVAPGSALAGQDGAHPLAQEGLPGKWARGSGEALTELCARADVQLAEHAAQMRLDGRLGHEELGRDLSVRLAARGMLRDPQLARGERIEAAAHHAARPRARGAQLGERALDQRVAPASTRLFHARDQRLARVDPAAEASQRSAEIDQRPGVLQARAGSRERALGLLEELDLLEGESVDAEGRSDRGRGAERARKR